MSHGRLATLQRQARLRVLRQALAVFLPWLLVSVALASRLGGLAWTLPGAVAGWMLLRAIGGWRALDLPQVARALDARYAQLEDSTGLLLSNDARPGALASLQRDRVATRLAAIAPTPSLGPAPDWRRWIANAVAAVLLGCLILYLPAMSAPPPSPPAAPMRAAVALPAGLRAAELHVVAPAYTGLPPQRIAGLDARVAEGAVVSWSLQAQGEVSSLVLHFHDGERLPLRREGEAWRASRRIDSATLYRVEVDGRRGAWQRLSVLPDRAPRIRVFAPDRSLSLIEPGQARWSLDFEARDDYGLGAAQLRVTLAQGSGENIQVSARTLALSGSGNARQRRYRHVLDLAALGFAEGDDLVVRLSVADNRQPKAQRAHSASFILRWPPQAGAEASGVEGLVQRTLPAYFRSQRQIIIDTEALLAERPRPAQAAWMARSDGIGVDQRLLRLRYGQFLGEESEDGRPEEHDGQAAGRGDAQALVQQFGHTHDIPEAATLLDPQTRKLLKAALDAMWQSEGELRLGRPQQALPHEYRALRLVKQVQQASRIYLSRVGLEQAPVDMGRRMGGKREGIAPRSAAAPVREAAGEPAALALWKALDAHDAAAARAAADALEREVGEQAEAADALALLGALDRWRNEPGCVACLDGLRAALWPRLPQVPAAVAPRERGDARGQAYLDALGSGAAP